MAHEEEWFNDNPFDPGEVHIQTLLDAEVAPTGDRLAVVRGDNQETIRFLEMSGPPPDPPTPVTGCWFANPSGKFVSWVSVARPGGAFTPKGGKATKAKRPVRLRR